MDERYRDRGLTIVAVQVQQTADDGREYASRYGLRFAIGQDVSAAVFHQYRVFALPTQFFIDQSGIIRAVVNGPLGDAAAASLIQAILPPAPSGSP
jgi:peroxiredoxin